jgi:hypothetical protein
VISIEIAPIAKANPIELGSEPVNKIVIVPASSGAIPEPERDSSESISPERRFIPPTSNLKIESRLKPDKSEPLVMSEAKKASNWNESRLTKPPTSKGKSSLAPLNPTKKISSGQTFGTATRFLQKKVDTESGQG